MPHLDPDLCNTLAYALWRSHWRRHLHDLEACRMAARDLAAHLERAGYRCDRSNALEPHGGLARGRSKDGAA